MLTIQEAFDKAVAGLRSQGFTRSMESPSACAYNGKDGKHCAVGWLLVDVPLGEADNTISVGTLIYSPELADKVRAILPKGPGSSPFLRELQNAHDSAYEYVRKHSEAQDDEEDRPLKMWANLKLVAAAHGLDDSALGPAPSNLAEGVPQ